MGKPGKWSRETKWDSCIPPMINPNLHMRWTVCYMACKCRWFSGIGISQTRGWPGDRPLELQSFTSEALRGKQKLLHGLLDLEWTAVTKPLNIMKQQLSNNLNNNFVTTTVDNASKLGPGEKKPWHLNANSYASLWCCCTTCHHQLQRP